MFGEKEALSPVIHAVSWGKMEVEGLGRGKDFKLWPGGGKSWNWDEHGTGHSQGIQIGDCDELLQNGSKIIILSRGMFKRLKVKPQVLAHLARNNVEVIVEETKKAVQCYNRLAEEGKAVGGLFHTTC